MAKRSYENWTVLPHGPIARLDDGLWRVEGTLPNMPLKRVMTVVRLATGEILIHNPVALEADAMRELESFGRVAYLVVPNGWHRLDLHPFAARYSTAVVLAPPGSLAKVAEVEPRVRDIAAFPADPNVSLSVFDGSGGLEAVMTVRAGAGVTLVLADVLFNMPHLRGLHGFILRHVTGSSGGPRVSRIARLFMVKDRKAYAAQLERLATPDLRRVIVAHHETLSDDPAAALRRVAASLR